MENAARGTRPADVSSGETFAVVVVIEKYEDGNTESLPGLAERACAFVNLLRNHAHIPPEHIQVFGSLLRPESVDNLCKLGIRGGSVNPATYDVVHPFVQKLGSDEIWPSGRVPAEAKLVLYWAGHGVLDDRSNRLLVYPDAKLDGDLRNLDVLDLMRELREASASRFPAQLGFIDACADAAPMKVLPGKFSPGPEGQGSLSQRFYLGAANGQAVQAGQFSGIITETLKQAPVSDWFSEHLWLALKEKLPTSIRIFYYDERGTAIEPRGARTEEPKALLVKLEKPEPPPPLDIWGWLNIGLLGLIVLCPVSWYVQVIGGDSILASWGPGGAFVGLFLSYLLFPAIRFDWLKAKALSKPATFVFLILLVLGCAVQWNHPVAVVAMSGDGNALEVFRTDDAIPFPQPVLPEKGKKRVVVDSKGWDGKPWVFLTETANLPQVHCEAPQRTLWPPLWSFSRVRSISLPNDEGSPMVLEFFNGQGDLLDVTVVIGERKRIFLVRPRVGGGAEVSPGTMDHKPNLSVTIVQLPQNLAGKVGPFDDGKQTDPSCSENCTFFLPAKCQHEAIPLPFVEFKFNQKGIGNPLTVTKVDRKQCEKERKYCHAFPL